MVLSWHAGNGSYGPYRLYVWYIFNRAHTEHHTSNSELDNNIMNMTDEQLVAEWLKNNEVTECEAFERTDPDDITWKRTKGTKKQKKS